MSAQDLWLAITHLEGSHTAGSCCKLCVAARGVLRAAKRCRHRKHHDNCPSCVAREMVNTGMA